MRDQGEVGIPEGRRRAPTTQMLTLMRLLGIPGFAEGGDISWGDRNMLEGWGMVGTAPPTSYAGPGGGTGLGPGQVSPDAFFNAAQAQLQGQQATAREGELNQFSAALNDVAGIANVGRIQRQRQAYDPRYAMAGLETPIENLAPLTGPMGALPPGQRWALEAPAERLNRLFDLNEQQRRIDLAKLQAPDAEKQIAVRQAIRDYYDGVGDPDNVASQLATLLGLPSNLVKLIFNPGEFDDDGAGGGTGGGGWTGGGTGAG
jgi:hypothetical protein